MRLESRPPNIEGRGEITIRDLVRNSLRMRPDRIVVGEVRGAESLDMLQAMNTGHEGSISTIARELAARRGRAHGDARAHGGHGPAAPRDPRTDRLGDRPHRADHAAQGRRPPSHARHRGARHGGRDHHPAGRVHVRLLAGLRRGRAAARSHRADRRASSVRRAHRRSRHRAAGRRSSKPDSETCSGRSDEPRSSSSAASRSCLLARLLAVVFFVDRAAGASGRPRSAASRPASSTSRRFRVTQRDDRGDRFARSPSGRVGSSARRSSSWPASRRAVAIPRARRLGRERARPPRRRCSASRAGRRSCSPWCSRCLPRSARSSSWSFAPLGGAPSSPTRSTTPCSSSPAGCAPATASSQPSRRRGDADAPDERGAGSSRERDPTRPRPRRLARGDRRAHAE